MAACYSNARVPRSDFSTPLHVDCSVEYELPAHAKPPPGVKVEPLLMIHPCHFRRLESQRRRPFVNNLPRRRRTPAYRQYEVLPSEVAYEPATAVAPYVQPFEAAELHALEPYRPPAQVASTVVAATPHDLPALPDAYASLAWTEPRRTSRARGHPYCAPVGVPPIMQRELTCYDAV